MIEWNFTALKTKVPPQTLIKFVELDHAVRIDSLDVRTYPNDKAVGILYSAYGEEFSVCLGSAFNYDHPRKVTLDYYQPSPGWYVTKAGNIFMKRRHRKDWAVGPRQESYTFFMSLNDTSECSVPVSILREYHPDADQRNLAWVNRRGILSHRLSICGDVIQYGKSIVGYALGGGIKAPTPQLAAVIRRELGDLCPVHY